jgi:hypothetical protein
MRLPLTLTTRSFSADQHDALIRVYDDAGNVIETYEHAGEFKELGECGPCYRAAF